LSKTYCLYGNHRPEQRGAAINSWRSRNERSNVRDV